MWVHLRKLCRPNRVQVDAVFAEIEKQQNVTASDQVKVDKVAPALLEELGDAVMGVLIGNTDCHDAMDRMLGGDGSPQLTAFHTNLGEQYLVNGGLNGVRLGGPWGVGRFGMMYGWGNPGDKKTGKTVTTSFMRSSHPRCVALSPHSAISEHDLNLTKKGSQPKGWKRLVA